NSAGAADRRELQRSGGIRSPQARNCSDPRPVNGERWPELPARSAMALTVGERTPDVLQILVAGSPPGTPGSGQRLPRLGRWPVYTKRVPIEKYNFGEGRHHGGTLAALHRQA